MNYQLLHNYANIWYFINFLQWEEKRVTSMVIQWSSGASKKKNYRTTIIQSRIKTLHKRYNANLIDAFKLLTGLPFVVAKKVQ